MTDTQNSPTESNAKTPVKNREWIADLLERVPFVEWDRFAVNEFDQGQRVNVYGWIDRDDEYKDFVLVHFWPENEHLDFTSSSEEYSEELVRIWFGEDAVEDHNPCRRVEHAFNVENAIELGEQATLVTDGGIEQLPTESKESSYFAQMRTKQYWMFVLPMSVAFAAIVIALKSLGAPIWVAVVAGIALSEVSDPYVDWLIDWMNAEEVSKA